MLLFLSRSTYLCTEEATLPVKSQQFIKTIKKSESSNLLHAKYSLPSTFNEALEIKLVSCTKVNELQLEKPSTTTICTSSENEELDKFMSSHVEMCKQVPLSYINEEAKLREVWLPNPPVNPVLILDLDETLIGRVDGSIFARPYAIMLISTLKEIFDIWVWTASDKVYADFALEAIGAKESIKMVLGREYCIQCGEHFIKDIRVFGNLDCRKTVIVDNLIVSFISELRNGIVVGSYYGDDTDSELYDLIGLLIELSKAPDVRIRISEYFNYTRYLGGY